MPLLTNEERLRRLRLRWKRQQEDRKLGRHKTMLPTIDNLTSGVSRVYRERLITPAMMRMGEKYFWGKRGYDTQSVAWTGGMP